MTLGAIAGLLMVAALLIFVFRPLVEARATRRALDEQFDGDRLETLLFQREAALQAIHDLRMDHAMGKLSDEDFAPLEARATAEAIELLRALDALGHGESPDDEEALDAWIERAVARARGGGTPSGSSPLQVEQSNP